MKSPTIKGSFRERAIPLSPDYRPLYKIGLIVLILDIACRGNKSSLNKLHLLIWALKSETNMAYVRMAFIMKDTSKIISWAVEPALNKALKYAVAEGLITMYEDKYQLTEKGVSFGKKLKKDSEIFTREKLFLTYIGKQKVTEDFINKLTEQQHDKN